MSAAGGITEEVVYAGGLGWRVATSGPKNGAPVLLLHGFPEYWATWTPQIIALSEAGFRVYAADLPGYGGTDEPDSYESAEVAARIADLATELDAGGVHLIGHDWGGIIGHSVASGHPETILSFAAVCAPHPGGFKGVLRDPFQIVRSWYVGAFQVPGIEHLLAAHTTKLLKGAVTEIDGPEAMRRAIAYYRANLAPWKLGRNTAGRIEVPGLLVHAGRDIAIGRALIDASADQFTDLRGLHELDGHHFLQRSRTDELNQVLLEFLREVS